MGENRWDVLKTRHGAGTHRSPGNLFANPPRSPGAIVHLTRTNSHPTQLVHATAHAECAPPQRPLIGRRAPGRPLDSGSPLCQGATVRTGVGSWLSPGSDCSEVLAMGIRSAALD
jgi:hypothetical protein